MNLTHDLPDPEFASAADALAQVLIDHVSRAIEPDASPDYAQGYSDGIAELLTSLRELGPLPHGLLDALADRFATGARSAVSARVSAGGDQDSTGEPDQPRADDEKEGEGEVSIVYPDINGYVTYHVRLLRDLTSADVDGESGGYGFVITYRTGDGAEHRLTSGGGSLTASAAAEAVKRCLSSSVPAVFLWPERYPVPRAAHSATASRDQVRAALVRLWSEHGARQSSSLACEGGIRARVLAELTLRMVETAGWRREAVTA